MINLILYAVLLILGIPSGLYLAKICKDEIKKWRKRMVFISVLCFILIFILLFINFEYKIPYIMGLCFIIITFLTIVFKSSIVKHVVKKN
jgi:uncharacterized protein HemY